MGGFGVWICYTGLLFYFGGEGILALTARNSQLLFSHHLSQIFSGGASVASEPLVSGGAFGGP